jgi:hypothetical protein
MMDAENQLGLGHLRREVRTALELAVVGLAPSDLVDRLAAAAGLLESLIELPPKSPQVLALVPELVTRSKAALEEWKRWRTERWLDAKA